MGFSITQWNQQNKTNDKSSDIRVLEKAKRLELARVRDGWRYIPYGNGKELLVPCDKDGKPTRQGELMLLRYKKM